MLKYFVIKITNNEVKDCLIDKDVDLAFVVVCFFLREGSFQNYYMILLQNRHLTTVDKDI